MSVKEQVTLLRTEDKVGNQTIHYPITRVGCVDGLEEYLEEQLEGLGGSSGGSGMLPQVIVTVASGSTVTCSLGATTLTATSTGTATFDLPSYGTWTVTASLNGSTTSDTVSVTEVKQYTLALAFFSATLTVTSDAGATVSAVSSSKTVTGTIASGQTSVALTIPIAGTYSVTATKDGETSDAVSVNVTTSGAKYTADCSFYVADFSQATAAQVQKVIDAGMASTLWSAGDELNITSKSGEAMTIVIMGFNHDDLTKGGKADVTFGLKNLMASTRAMNSSNVNSGGFAGSAMYTWLQGTMLADLPDEWQAIIVPVNKKTSAGGASSAINTNSMKLFLFSEIEIFGTTTYSAAGEGSQYAYFTTAANRIKYLSNGTGSANIWWERSPYSGNSTYLCYVSSVGNAYANSAGSSGGVCFGFCVASSI